MEIDCLKWEIDHKDYIIANKSEVVTMCITEYDEWEYMNKPLFGAIG